MSSPYVMGHDVVPCAACQLDRTAHVEPTGPGVHPRDVELCARCRATAALLRCQRHASELLPDGRSRSDAVSSWQGS